MCYSILTSHFRLYEPITLKSVAPDVIYKGLQWLVLGSETSRASIHSSLSDAAPSTQAFVLSHTPSSLMPWDLCTCALCLKCSFSKWAHPRFTPLFHSSLCSTITPPKTLPSFICLVWYLSLPEIIDLFILPLPFGILPPLICKLFHG